MIYHSNYLNTKFDIQFSPKYILCCIIVPCVQKPNCVARSICQPLIDVMIISTGCQRTDSLVICLVQVYKSGRPLVPMLQLLNVENTYTTLLQSNDAPIPTLVLVLV